MRLLHTTRLKLEEFSGNSIPPYAILSHTWGEMEVTFRDMRWDLAEKMVGYEKIESTCSIAAACGYDYVWIDTCCIDKTSSAELSEAINSMFHWYREAEVCFAYLVDVQSTEDQNMSDDEYHDFSKSRWFTRGWTLQELIAPSIMIFLNKQWQIIGTKSTLKNAISEITGIPVNILSGGELAHSSIAQRMSWASRRETTRLEDLAYSLLGIFGIQMPLLYGEGERAFVRLQEEIMKVSDDYSLFAWRSQESSNELLATSPRAFINSGNIVQLRAFNRYRNLNGPLTTSNKGIHLTVPFKDLGDQTGLVILNCTEKDKDEDSTCFAIRVRDISLTKEYFERDQCDKLELWNMRSLECPLRNICVRRGRPTRKRKSEIDKTIKEKEIMKAMKRRRLFLGETDNETSDSDGGPVTGDEEIGDAEPAYERSKRVRMDGAQVDDGESSEVTLFQCRAKLYAIQSKEVGWKERGVGNLKVNVPKSSVRFDDNGNAITGSFDASLLEDEGRYPSSSRVARLNMRQESTHRVILNTMILSVMEFLDSKAMTSRAQSSTAHILFTAFEGEKEARPVNMLLKISERNSQLFRSEIESIQFELQEAEQAGVFVRPPSRKTQHLHARLSERPADK